MLHAPLGSHAVRGSIGELGSRLVDALLYVPRLGYHFEVTADANGTFLEPAALPGLHLASSCGCRPDPVVCALRTIGDSTHYVRRLARGLRLMTMHVVVWAICVRLLPSLAIAKHPRKT